MAILSNIITPTNVLTATNTQTVILIILCALILVGCGGGSDPEPSTISVQLPANTVLPAPFVLGPGGTQPSTALVGPIVTFVAGPVVGPVAVVTNPIVSTLPNPAEPNWCTNGVVVGPCVDRCPANQPVVGPC